VSSTKTQVPFARAAIIGTGLIGGSFALALRKHFPEITVIGFDRPEAADRALARGAIQRVEAGLDDAVSDADLVYVALPIGRILEVLPRVAERVKPGALVTDAGSTKAQICREAAKVFTAASGGARFLGGHPIAGKETSGIEFADENLFVGSSYALIADENDGDARVHSFAEILTALGATPVWCDAETHDWAVSIASHLPQMLSVALAGVVRDEADETGLPMALAGQGLRDMLRLAGSPFHLWRDVTHTNKENISRALDRMTQAIEHLRVNLTSKELEEEFRGANEVYKGLKKKD
jgi:prephenate dehydrogenase